MTFGSLFVVESSSQIILREYLYQKVDKSCTTFISTSEGLHSPIYTAMYGKTIRFQLVITIQVPNKVRAL